MRRLFALLAIAALPVHGAEPTLFYVQGDRVEYRAEHSETLLDLQGWIGGDLSKFWWKAEGELGEANHGEFQALYSRAWLPYFDWQAGIAQQLGDGPAVTSAVIGMQGLAPQWFEVDVAGLLSEDGDLALKFEAEYDLLLTQRLVLQPRFELGAGTISSEERGIGSGLRNTAFGLRLRYEFRREIAPYVGVSWTRSYGGTRDFIELEGEEASGATVVAGLRFWF